MNDGMGACANGVPVRRFATVNRAGSACFREGWQKHHLLPRQTASRRGFVSLFAALRPAAVWIDDFDSNGVLLPATEEAASHARLPLHRGPHRVYNELVFERVGTIEMEWSQTRSRDELQAKSAAIARLRILQRALARRLLGEGRSHVVLNRRDPIGRGVDFRTLDAMAEQLWGATGAAS